MSDVPVNTPNTDEPNPLKHNRLDAVAGASQNRPPGGRIQEEEGYPLPPHQVHPQNAHLITKIPSSTEDRLATKPWETATSSTELLDMDIVENWVGFRFHEPS